MLPAYKKVTMLNTIESFGCISISDNKINFTNDLTALVVSYFVIRKSSSACQDVEFFYKY